MKLDISKEEKEHLLKIINSYKEVSSEFNKNKNIALEIEKKITELTKKLDELHEEETKIMDELHAKYGKFNIQDISDSIYG